MKVDVKKLKKSQIELTITVDYSDYAKAEAQAIKALGGEMKVDGFREGSIPEDIVREKAGPETVTGATLEFLIPDIYTKAVQQNNLQVISQPKVNVVKQAEKEGDEFVFTATVAVMPEVKLGNYKKIKVKKEVAKVEQKNIDETIGMIKDRFAEWKDVDRKSKKNDRVETSFEGFDEKGEAIANTASKNHPLVLGSNMMVPGFEDALVGKAKGDEVEFDVTFPNDYHAEPMRGKKVKFKATVHRVEEKAEQALDEAFIEKISGKKQSVDEFKALVEKDLLAEMENRINQAHFDKVIAEIIKIVSVDLPDELIQQEVDLMINEQKQRIKEQGLSWEQYLEHVKKSEEELRNEMNKSAQERLMARLGVSEIIKDAEIEVSDEEVQAKIDELTAQYPDEQKDKVIQHYQKGSQAYQGLKYRLMVDKLIESMTK